MTPKVKKIVAREGLVIISLFVLVLALNLLPNSIVLKSNKCDLKSSEELYEVTTEYLLGLEKVYEIVVDKSLPPIKEFERENITKGKTPVVKESLSFGNWKAMSILIPFLGYPLYLLIRFIIWAIRTLKAE